MIPVCLRRAWSTLVIRGLAETEVYGYNPQKAKELLKQAGYEGKRIKTSVLTSTSGSGQMLPLPMNEFIQENWRAVGIDLEIIPLEWNTLRARYRKGFRDPENAEHRHGQCVVRLRGTLQRLHPVLP